MQRKDLLMEEEAKEPINKEKLAKELDEGRALVGMKETRGWKIVYEGFIIPNTEEARFLEASREELADIRAEMRVLRRLQKFIDTRITAANKAAEKIKR